MLAHSESSFKQCPHVVRHAGRYLSLFMERAWVDLIIPSEIDVRLCCHWSCSNVGSFRFRFQAVSPRGSACWALSFHFDGGNMSRFNHSFRNRCEAVLPLVLQQCRLIPNLVSSNFPTWFGMRGAIFPFYGGNMSRFNHAFRNR